MKYRKNEPGERCNALRAPGVELVKRDNSKNTKNGPKRQAARIMFEGKLGPCTFTIKGRDLWALCELVKAGAVGVTPIDCPAPRWSAYIFNLRALGQKIETIHEPHGGPFPGIHARYVLRSPVAIEGGCYASA